VGVGAGLDGRWFTRVAANDIEDVSGVVVGRLADPSPRSVAVLGTWEDEILDLAATAGDEFLIGGRSRSRNRASTLAASLVVAHGHPLLGLPAALDVAGRAPGHGYPSARAGTRCLTPRRHGPFRPAPVRPRRRLRSKDTGCCKLGGEGVSTA
jgi:hypothetical protein